MQAIIFLNVPARQSKGYFDYLYSNLARDNIVFVDALFGGLDVAARLKWSTESAEQFITQEVKRLIVGNPPDDAALAKVTPIFDDERAQIRENFIIVLCVQQNNMNHAEHRKTFDEYLKRYGIKRYLRFAGIVQTFEQVDKIPRPSYLSEDIQSAPEGKIIILEFSVKSLDDPRLIVMDKLQQFPGVQATRTFFGVNYGVERTRVDSNMISRGLSMLSDWSEPALKIIRSILPK